MSYLQIDFDFYIPWYIRNHCKGINKSRTSKWLRHTLNMMSGILLSDSDLRKILRKHDDIQAWKGGYFVPANQKEFYIGQKHLRLHAMSTLKRLKREKQVYPEFVKDQRQLELFDMIDRMIDYLEE